MESSKIHFNLVEKEGGGTYCITEKELNSPQFTTEETSVSSSFEDSTSRFPRIEEKFFYSITSITVPCYRVHFGSLITFGDVYVQFGRHSFFINASTTTPEVIVDYTNVDQVGFHRERPFTLILMTREAIHKDISVEHYDSHILDMTSKARKCFEKLMR